MFHQQPHNFCSTERRNNGFVIKNTFILVQVVYTNCSNQRLTEQLCSNVSASRVFRTTHIISFIRTEPMSAFWFQCKETNYVVPDIAPRIRRDSEINTELHRVDPMPAHTYNNYYSFVRTSISSRSNTQQLFTIQSQNLSNDTK